MTTTSEVALRYQALRGILFSWAGILNGKPDRPLTAGEVGATLHELLGAVEADVDSRPLRFAQETTR